MSRTLALAMKAERVCLSLSQPLAGYELTNPILMKMAKEKVLLVGCGYQAVGDAITRRAVDSVRLSRKIKTLVESSNLRAVIPHDANRIPPLTEFVFDQLQDLRRLN